MPSVVRRNATTLKVQVQLQSGPMTFRLIYFICTALALLAIGCNRSNNQRLILTQSSFEKIDEVDTIEAYPERGLYILRVIRNGALGHFTSRLAFEKQTGQTQKATLCYEVNEKSFFRVSKDYISFVDTKMGERNWGWFELQNGKVVEPLSNAGKIEDSLKKANKDYFIQESGGYFSFYSNGHLIKTLNYGNFTTKNRETNFDSLNYNLYKLDGDSLTVISKTGNDLFKQGNGIYFLPKPGYGVKRMYSKKEILHFLDSVSKSASPPTRILIKPVQ
jgi:hypothetical protein